MFEFFSYVFAHFFSSMERDLMTRTDRFGVEVRERTMWDIRDGVVGAETFVPKHVVITTWKNVSFAGGIDNSLFTVSATKDTHKYVDSNIFIYLVGKYLPTRCLDSFVCVFSYSFSSIFFSSKLNDLRFYDA